MLWKFRKNATGVEHYLMGTMHLATKEAYTFATNAQLYINKSEVYLAEMDLDTVDVDDVLTSFVLQEQSLDTLILSRHFNKMCHILHKSFNMDLRLLNNYTPFYILNLLSDRVIEKKYNTTLDQFLWEFAKKNNKKMGGLETFHDQKDIMSKIPLDFQIKSLRSCAKNPSVFKKNVEHLNHLYSIGNYNQLYKSTKRSMGGLRQLMIYDRNESMVSRLIPQLNGESTFISVGAAHLPGNKGMINLLKGAGYKVKFIKN